MSTVYTVDGVLRFDDEDTFNKVVAAFQHMNLLTDDLRWFETEEPAVPDTATPESPVIDIPYNSYRNLFREEETTVQRASEYGVVWTTADGEFVGGYETHEGSGHFDLEEWAEDQPDFGPAPPAETDEEFDEYVSWQMDVEGAFMEEFSHVIPRDVPSA